MIVGSLRSGRRIGYFALVINLSANLTQVTRSIGIHIINTGLNMLNFIIRFIVTLLIIAGVAFILPTLVIFFLQVLITVSVFLVILFVLSLFYKGDKDV